ncbi:MAG: YqgE/AlgH family protein [Candidatus Binataceae bacterium]|nr:YqgE/AlgH family protein [Candidatus Binataceae bacterium]
MDFSTESLLIAGSFEVARDKPPCMIGIEVPVLPMAFAEQITSRRCVWLFAALISVSMLLVCSAGRGSQSRAAEAESTFLVAKPDMPDPLFAHSVIMMIPHQGDDPLVIGLIVNKPIKGIPLSKLFPDSPALKQSGATAFFGGPIDIETPAVLIKSTRPLEHAIHLAGDVYVSMDLDLAAKMARDPKQVRQFRVIVGRAQWSVEQLHGEILRGAWYTVTADPNIVFNSDPATVWRTLSDRARLIPIELNFAPRDLGRSPSSSHRISH